MLQKNVHFHFWVTSSEADKLTKSKNKIKILLLRSYTCVNKAYSIKVMKISILTCVSEAYFNQGYENFYPGWSPLYELLYWIMLMFILIYTEVKMSIFFAEQNWSLIEKTPFIMCYSETVLFFEEKEQSSERNLVVRKSFYSTFFGLGCFVLMPVIYF